MKNIAIKLMQLGYKGVQVCYDGTIQAIDKNNKIIKVDNINDLIYGTIINYNQFISLIANKNIQLNKRSIEDLKRYNYSFYISLSGSICINYNSMSGSYASKNSFKRIQDILREVRI